MDSDSDITTCYSSRESQESMKYDITSSDTENLSSASAESNCIVYNIPCILNRYNVLQNEDVLNRVSITGRTRNAHKPQTICLVNKGAKVKANDGVRHQGKHMVDRQAEHAAGLTMRSTRNSVHPNWHTSQVGDLTNKQGDNEPPHGGQLTWSNPLGETVSQTLGSLNTVPVSIKNRSYRAMIDTGAGANCIQKIVLKQLKLCNKIDRSLKRILKDAQGQEMKVDGGMNITIRIGDLHVDTHFIVVEKLPLPIILGTPFLGKTGARLDYTQNTLHMQDSSVTLVLTPILQTSISIHTTADTYLLPHSDTTIHCRAIAGAPITQNEKAPAKHSKWEMLEIQRSQALFGEKSVIVKPSTAFRQSNGMYPVTIINPLSKTVKLSKGLHLTEATLKHRTPYKPSGELPDNILLGPNHPLHDSNLEFNLEKLDETDYSENNLNAIQVLWPKQEYCPPVQIGRKTQHNRTVGCQVEVDVGNQTRIQTFKPIDWNECLKLEHKAEPYRQKLLKILGNHREAFAVDLTELAILRDVYYRIDLRADATPVNKKAYKMSPEHEAELDRQISKLAEADIIKPSQSLWGVPCFVVYKYDKEGRPYKPRLVVDFKPLNQMIIPAKAPIPTVNDIIDTLAAGKNKVYSVVDLASAFYAIQLSPDSTDICAMNTRTQKYSFNRLAMGMANSPEVFSSLMSRCLATMDPRYVVSYMDDILVMTPTYELHLKVLNELFWRLRQVGFRISPTKADFMQSSVKYLGYVFDKNGVRANPDKLQAVVKLPPPKTVKNVRQIMGAFNFYRRFIKSFSKIAQPINELLRKEEPFVWTEDRQNALDTLKAALLNNAVLYSPDPDKPFTICLDASDRSVGSIISQVDSEGVDRPCVFMSKSLTDCQTRYHSNEKEALALVESLKQCENLLGPRVEIDVYSDNLTNVYLSSLSAKSGRLFRYRMYLNKFNIDVKHKVGKLNVVADMLSRLEYRGQPVVSDEEEPDKHALITPANCMYDDAITCIKDKSTTTIGAMTRREVDSSEEEAQARQFDMFDAFTPDNYPPHRRKDIREKRANKQVVAGNRHTDENALGSSDVIDPADLPLDDSEEEETRYTPADRLHTRDAHTPPMQHYRMHPAEHHHYNSNSTNTQQHRHENNQEHPSNTQDKGTDDFLLDSHGLNYDDLHDLQVQDSLEVYNEVLKNSRRLASEQAADRDSADIYQYKLNKTLPEQLNLARRVMAEEDKFYLDDQGVLFRKFHPQPGEKLCHQIVLPAKHRFRVSALFHHGIHGAHRGFHGLLHIVRQRFYWRGMYEDLLKFVMSCHACGASKRDYSHIKAPLHLRPACRALEVVHLDVLKVAPTRAGEHKVLVVTDRFTKHFEIECIPNERADTMAQTFLNMWIQRFGPPKLVVLDRAAAHMSVIFKALAEQFNIKLRFITSWHPAANAAVERVHSKILVSLRACMMEFPNRPWTSFLSHVRWSNDMAVQTNGYSPYELMYGLEPALSGDLELDPPIISEGPAQDTLECVWPDLVAMREAAANNARHEAENMKQRHDQRFNARYKGFKPGDLVWLSNPLPKTPSQYKVAPKYKGPFTVMATPRPGFHMLRIHNETLKQLFHEERLKRYIPTGQSSLRTRVITGRVGEQTRANTNNLRLEEDGDAGDAANTANAGSTAAPKRHTKRKRRKRNSTLHSSTEQRSAPHASVMLRNAPSPNKTSECRDRKRPQSHNKPPSDKQIIEKGSVSSNLEVMQPKHKYNLRNRKRTPVSERGRARLRHDSTSSSDTDYSEHDQQIHSRAPTVGPRSPIVRRSQSSSSDADSESSYTSEVSPTHRKRQKLARDRRIHIENNRRNRTYNYPAPETRVADGDQKNEDPEESQYSQEEVHDSNESGHSQCPNMVSSSSNMGKTHKVDEKRKTRRQEPTQRIPNVDKRAGKTMRSHKSDDNLANQHIQKNKQNPQGQTLTQPSRNTKQPVADPAMRGSSNPNIDWSKLKCIATMKDRKHGKSYMCLWKNRRPSWLKDEVIPVRFIENYNNRIRLRKTLKMLRQQGGNVN